MKITKTYDEINRKIADGKAVILTAEEVSKMAEKLSPQEIVKKIDVVTTATFSPMCSSGAFINFGHSKPEMRMEKASLNDVPVFTGLAAVDAYIGATEESPYNNHYGGAHIIEELIAGKNVKLKAWAKGTDCYPRKEIETWINKNSVNEIFMFNPRNSYQNYCAATNTGNKIKYTYMGILLPHLGNATYATSGELSPLINDPELLTIGIGTRIFLCGAQGYIAWNGTQFNTSVKKNIHGIPTSNAATLATIGDLKQMSIEFIQSAYFEKYGVSIFIGIGVPIPILNADIAKFVSIQNKDIETSIVDYSKPDHPVIKTTNYKDLMDGQIFINGKKVRTAPMSSLKKAREIADKLKELIENKEFFLTQPVQMLPKNTSLKNIEIKND